MHQLFGPDLPARFAGYVTVSVNKPVHPKALAVAWGAGVQGGIQYSNFPVRADATVPHARQISADNLQQALDQVRRDYNIVGISAAVVVRGQLAWKGVSGNSFPGDPITSDMYRDIGSAVKNLVAALALKLSEEGLLSLEDPVSQWLPGYRNVDGRVTIRQLLDHNSGIGNFTANQSFWDAVFRDPTRRWLPEEVLSYIGGIGKTSCPFLGPGYSSLASRWVGMDSPSASDSGHVYFRADAKLRMRL